MFVQNLMRLPWRRALSPTASEVFTPTALVLLSNFDIILALISASLLTSKLLSDFHYLFHHICVFISECKILKSLLFALLMEKKHRNPSCGL